MKTTIREVELKTLTETEHNPRQISKKDFETLKKSLKEFPEMQEIREIVVDENMTILGGHQRVKAMLANGQEKATVKIVEGLTDDQKREFIIKDNIQSGEWDFDALANSWDNLPLEDWGIPLLPIEDNAEPIEEDEAPEPPAEPVSKLGEIYQLGKHRLMCGDSTDAGSVAILMDGQKADMVFTDPPYGMKKEAEGVLNDNLNYDKLLDFNKKWIPLTFDNLKDNGSWYCWGIDEPLMDIYSNILKPMQKENKITFRNLITWDKGNGQGQLSKDFRMFPIADEKCLFIMMGVQGFSSNADNYFKAWEPIRVYLKQERDRMGWSNADMKKMCGHSPTSGCHWFDKSQWMMPTEEEYITWQKNANGEGFKKKYEEIKKKWHETRAYFDNTHDNMNNVWHFGKTCQEERKDTGGHATPKPLALCQRAIKSSSRNNESVLDVFGGSGSTLIACEQLGRKCYMMELDPKYCDVIRKRWVKLTTGSEDNWQELTPKGD